MASLQGGPWRLLRGAGRLADHVPSQMRPVSPGRRAVLLAVQGLLAAEPLAHQVGDAAAVALHDVEQLVPEGAGAEAGHDGQVEADIDDGAAERTAADLGLELLQCGGVEIGGSVVRDVPQRAQCGRGARRGKRPARLGRLVWGGWRPDGRDGRGVRCRGRGRRGRGGRARVPRCAGCRDAGGRG